MVADRELPIIAFASKEAWKEWLAVHHDASAGLWVKIATRGSGADSVTYQEALDVALCYGWIDGQKGAFDNNFWLQKFTPRRSGSRWSKINRERALTLIERGEMQAAGLREIEKARADGRWDAAYEPQRTAEVPDDLQQALDQNDRAREFFARLDRRNRYAILYRIQDAKTPETRAKRIEKFVAMLNEGKKIYP